VHLRCTGQSNRLILENLKELDRHEKPIEIRIPFVPGCNSDAENMEASGAFLGQLNVGKVKLLPYHSLARNKYAALQMEDTMPRAETPSDEEMAQALDILKKYGLDAHSGRE
jgi:pyruvate formate lyase activating enzyme